MGESGKSTSTTSMRGTTIQVSLLRCRKTGRVLFLEAGKDFIDTLFSFLLLPVGTIIHMLSTAGVGGLEKPLGGISRLSESVKRLDPSFMHVDKTGLLQPRPAYASASGSIVLLEGLEAKPKLSDIKLPASYFRCNSLGNNCDLISSAEGTHCENCERRYHSGTFSEKLSVLPKDLLSLKMNVMRQVLEKIDPTVQEAPCSSSTVEGFVRGNITYLVTDSLEVMPSTMIKSIQVLNKLKVATLADMESTDISVSITQILQLLRSAMISSTCLNDVFFGKS